jgi:hypothetical protein
MKSSKILLLVTAAFSLGASPVPARQESSTADSEKSSKIDCFIYAGPGLHALKLKGSTAADLFETNGMAHAGGSIGLGFHFLKKPLYPDRPDSKAAGMLRVDLEIGSYKGSHDIAGGYGRYKSTVVPVLTTFSYETALNEHFRSRLGAVLGVTSISGDVSVNGYGFRGSDDWRAPSATLGIASGLTLDANQHWYFDLGAKLVWGSKVKIMEDDAKNSVFASQLSLSVGYKF